MPISLDVGDINNFPHRIQIDAHPDNCPLCNKHLIAQFVSGTLIKDQHCQLAYRCTNKDCSSYFIGYYYKTMGSDGYYLMLVRPNNPEPLFFEDEVKELSPHYCEIFNEAYYAEKNDYKQVAGCGYRKALEFLIKDYCIHLYPDKEKEIKEQFLQKVIKTYIDDETIKHVAEKATWLGNDETHYIRKWEYMDIQNLKELIDLTKYWIVAKMKSEKYRQKMADPKK